ncbi:unnamed protein product [Lymnaea stagnalis]|uniref:Uncharacterized protein n=1 Tax=Lymnaea stagnalis TaxID=6523 RepID=A0AAV2HPE3_LYMST
MRLLLVTCFLAALFQNTWAQPDNTTTAAPPSNTTVGNVNTTANINVSVSSTSSSSSVTPVSGSSSTSTVNPSSTSTVNPSSTSTVNPSSNPTQSPAAPNITNNETTAASPNTTDANATTTLPTTTTTVTTTEKPLMDFSRDRAVFILTLTLGPNSTADVVYTNLNLTREQLLASISQYFQQSAAIDLTKRDGSDDYSLLLKFFFTQIYGINSTLEEKIRNATIDLNNTETELTVSSRTLEKISQFFQNASDDPCFAINVCPVGYDCEARGCSLRSSCGPDTCNGNGQCVVSLFSDRTTATKCICDESYDTEYYGDQCESSRTGKLQIIAIIAGVLGAAILVLLLIIIIICVTQRRKGSGYEISKGHKNKAYDGEMTS